MAVYDRYAAGVNNFCQNNFGVPAGDECRMELRNQYKRAW